MDKIVQIGIDIFTSLISALIIFIIGFIRWANAKPRVTISSFIAEGKNYSFKENGQKAYKFKIVNLSKIFTASDFDIQLTAIRKVKNKSEKRYTEHMKNIKIKYGGLRILTKYISDKKLNINDPIHFAYRIITFEKLDKIIKTFDYFRLSIKYKDNLNREFIIEKIFEVNKIIKGEFSNDGNINNEPS